MRPLNFMNGSKEMLEIFDFFKWTKGVGHGAGSKEQRNR
jgi:hypothetical protein